MSLKLHVLGQSWAPSQERPFVSRHRERSDALAGSNEWNCPCEGEEVRAGRKQKKGGRKMAEKKNPGNFNSHNTNWKQTRTRTNTTIATSRYKQDNDSNHKHNQQPSTTQEPEWTIVLTTSEQHVQFVINPLNFATQNQSAKHFYGNFDATYFFCDYPIYWIENGKKLSAATEKQFMSPSETHSKTNGHKRFFTYTPLKWLKSRSLSLNPSYGSCWCV